MQVWKEISIRIFHVELDGYLASRRRELDLRLLRTLLAFKQRARGPVGHRDVEALLCLRRCPCLLMNRLQSHMKEVAANIKEPARPSFFTVLRATSSSRGWPSARIRAGRRIWWPRPIPHFEPRFSPGFLMNSARFDKCLRRVRRTAAEPAASTGGILCKNDGVPPDFHGSRGR